MISYDKRINVKIQYDLNPMYQLKNVKYRMLSYLPFGFKVQKGKISCDKSTHI